VSKAKKRDVYLQTGRGGDVRMEKGLFLKEILERGRGDSKSRVAIQRRSESTPRRKEHVDRGMRGHRRRGKGGVVGGEVGW